MRKLLLVFVLLVPNLGCHKKQEAIYSNLVGPPPPEQFSEDGFQRSKTIITMKRSYVNKQTQLHDDLQTGARIERKAEGLRIGRIREDSIYHKLGFWDGDIILDQKDPFADEFEKRLKSESVIAIRILRNGGEQTVRISIEPS